MDAEADPEAVVVELEAMLQRLGGLGEALTTYNQVEGTEACSGLHGLSRNPCLGAFALSHVCTRQQQQTA